jgi:ABC-2 type transport system permease protein
VSASEELDFVVQNPQSGNQQHPQVAMYAAGIAVLFLLFSTTGNAATLLEEQETGTLDRILGSQAGLIDVIFGKWLWLFVLGVVQITVMFTWADLVFGIHLRDHLSGFLVMTASTSAATASFGMFLATVSGSRAQLSALSVLLILSMSALGGSMIPRFVMSTRMKEIGQWTFNAWAIDGYQKVFWYQLPIKSLQNEVFVLCGSAIILGLLSLILSRRWRPA